MLYALGWLVARYEGVAIDWPSYIIGQIAVTSFQLMGHYLNEYWDVEYDRLNKNRTFFSGGSGVLPLGYFPRRVAFFAGLVCLAIGVLSMAFLTIVLNGNIGIWLFLP